MSDAMLDSSAISLSFSVQIAYSWIEQYSTKMKSCQYTLSIIAYSPFLSPGTCCSGFAFAIGVANISTFYLLHNIAYLRYIDIRLIWKLNKIIRHDRISQNTVTRSVKHTRNVLIASRCMRMIQASIFACAKWMTQPLMEASGNSLYSACQRAASKSTMKAATAGARGSMSRSQRRTCTTADAQSVGRLISSSPGLYRSTDPSLSVSHKLRCIITYLSFEANLKVDSGSDGFFVLRLSLRGWPDPAVRPPGFDLPR